MQFISIYYIGFILNFILFTICGFPACGTFKIVGRMLQLNLDFIIDRLIKLDALDYI